MEKYDRKQPPSFLLLARQELHGTSKTGVLSLKYCHKKTLNFAHISKSLQSSGEWWLDPASQNVSCHAQVGTQDPEAQIQSLPRSWDRANLWLLNVVPAVDMLLSEQAVPYIFPTAKHRYREWALNSVIGEILHAGNHFTWSTQVRSRSDYYCEQAVKGTYLVYLMHHVRASFRVK